MSTSDENSRLPHWLKADIFEKVLKDTFKNFKEIKSFKAMPGTKPGDNYATIMLRIELEIELKGIKVRWYDLKRIIILTVNTYR